MKPATFFIVPGFGQKATDKNFSWLTKHLKQKEFNVIPVPIEWKYKVVSDYINDFAECFAQRKTSNNYVLGFSYGAVVALSTASRLLPKKIFLCSLSPDFKEDLPSMKPWIRKLVGKRRLEDSSFRSAKKIAKELKVPSVVFYGQKEGKQYPQLKKRCEETAKLASNSKLIVIPKAAHKIDHLEYKKAILKELEGL